MEPVDRRFSSPSAAESTSDLEEGRMGRTRVAHARLRSPCAWLRWSPAAVGSDSGTARCTLKFYGGLDPDKTNVKAVKECSAQSKRQLHDRARPAGQQRRRVARAARPAPGGEGLRHRPDQHGHDLDAGVRRGGLAARAQGRREGAGHRRRAARAAEVGRVEGRRLRRAAEHERAAALVPQGPRPEAARDVGRDDRDGQEAAGPARA